MTDWIPLALSPSDAEQLMRLRAMLDRALRAAELNYSFDNGTTAVLLDAVNDRASHFAAVSTGVPVGRSDSIETLHDKLCNRLSGWRPASFGAVRQLHRARNQAQHEGLTLDPDAFPGWASATVEYVHSVVREAFGVDLASVHLADALSEGQSASLLRGAEAALQAENYSVAMNCARGAFDVAATKWRQHHAHVLYRAPFPARARGLEQIVDAAINKAMAEVRDTAALTMFATDASEITWFREATNDAALCDAFDAKRAISFVFWWLVNWQRYESARVDRRDRANMAARHVRANPSDSARLGQLLEVSLLSDDRWRVRVAVENVPPATAFDVWATLVRQRLRDGGHDGGVEVDGVLMGYVVESALEDWILSAAGAIVDADDDARRIGAERKVQDVEDGRSRDSFLAALALRKDDLPDWARSVTIRSHIPWGDTPVISVAEAGNVLGGQNLRVLDTVREVIHAHNLSLVGVSGGYIVGPGLDFNRFAEAVTAANEAILPLLASDAITRERREKHTVEVQSRLTHALLSLSVDHQRGARG